MNVKNYIALAALTLPLAASAQSVIDFESNSGYTKVGVFDTWENSPFRTGKLNGNANVIANPHAEENPTIGGANTSAHVLAFQRSRYGSNTFGVRVELATPIALSQKVQYVHAKIYKPQDGRVMLFGLGSRDDRPWQSKEVVQVEASCISPVKTNGWYDAVFAVTGANGVSLHSLVFATDVESTHNLDADYVAYVDDIEVNNSIAPRIQYGVYPLNFDKGETLNRNDRYTKNIILKSADGEQTIKVNQQSDKLIYQQLLSSSLKAKAGETVQPRVDYNGSWMSAYVYLDQNNDGKFDCSLNENGTPADGSDVMSYSFYQNKNSKGESVPSGNVLTLSSFKIPEGLKNGFYRIRYKVDWDCIDAAGNPGNENGGNTIKGNGGTIIDTRLNVHGDKVNVSRGLSAAGTNGEVLKEDGTTFSKHEIKFGEAYTVKFKPGDGFKLSRVIIRHGYDVDKNDSLVNETPQYIDEIIPASAVKDNTYTIPAKYVDGDVVITPEFVTEDTELGDKYALNFSKDLKNNRTDRQLKSMSFNTAANTAKQTITIDDPTLVYQDQTKSSILVKKNDAISTGIVYTGGYMHGYLYVDLNKDGVFNTNLNSDGTPAEDGEMLSYYYKDGKNSKGESGINISLPKFSETNSIPQFTLPTSLPTGKYRARFKIDWDDDDPAGRYGKGSNDIDANGGYVVDFTLNVVDNYTSHKLDVATTNGSLVGINNTGLPETINQGQSFSIQAVGADEYYVADVVTVRHGKNLKGAQFVDGKKQWSEYTAELKNGVYTIPNDSVDGDILLTANFENTGSEYILKFDDEFDLPNGSQPDSKAWSRSTWATPTWKRYIARTAEGQAKTGEIEDGKLVLRCIANPFNAEKDNKGNKLEMISGAVESSNKITFTYGKVEGRLKTIGHTGNFPAFWMMPNASTYGGWPYSGEIDIWEQIDTRNVTEHTIHSKWANTKADGSECKGQTNNPAKNGKASATLGEYHVFGLEWTENLLKWFVDGKQVFSYAKSTSQSDLNNGQWPFDKPFYIILNQSVGNGSWAANRDLNFTYETKFDWVRVYQKDGGDITGINNASNATKAFDYYVTPGKVRIVAPNSTAVQIVDAQGRIVYNQTIQGNEDVYLTKGVYLVNNNKVLVP